MVSSEDAEDWRVQYMKDAWRVLVFYQVVQNKPAVISTTVVDRETPLCKLCGASAGRVLRSFFSITLFVRHVQRRVHTQLE